MVALGAFLLYQHLTGATVGSGGKDKWTVPPPTGPSRFLVEGRDKNGRLEYLITAPKSPAQMLDDQKRPLPGQYIIENPVAVFYTKDGRTLEVSADICQAVIDQGPRGGGGRGAGLPDFAGGAAAGGNKEKSSAGQMTLRTGLLRGHVKLTMGAQPAGSKEESAAKSSLEMFPRGLRAYLDGDLQLDGLQEILSTTEGIHLRSDTAEGDFQGMQLAINKDAKRIEYLRIDDNPKGNSLILRGMADRAGKMMDQKQPPTSARPATTRGAGTPAGRAVAAGGRRGAGAATQVAAGNARGNGPATTQASDAPKPAIYRLTLGQDVSGRSGSGDEVITSEQLYAMFKADQKIEKDEQGGGGGKANGAVGPAPASGPAMQRGFPESAELLAAVGKDDLILSWKGPAEMRPMEEKEIADLGADFDKEPLMLEAIGTATNPVHVKHTQKNKGIAKESAPGGAGGSAIEVFAGRLKYRGMDNPIELFKEAYGKVVLKSPAGDGSNDGSEVVSGDVVIDQGKLLATMAGPGVLRTQREGGHTEVPFSKGMNLELERVDDPTSPPDPAKNKPQGTVVVVKRALISGGRVASDSRVSMVNVMGDELDMRFVNHFEKALASTKPAGASSKPDWVFRSTPERFLATGHVIVNTKSKDNYELTGEEGGIETDRLELTSAKDPLGNILWSQMLADGNVTAWQLTRKGAGFTGGSSAESTGPSTRPGAKGDAAPAFQKRTISAPSLVADLHRKARAVTAAAASRPAGSGGSGADMAMLDGAGDDYDLSHLLAKTGVVVEILPMPSDGAGPGESRPIVARAATLEADPLAGTAVLSMAKGSEVLASVTMGESKISGPAIAMKQVPERRDEQKRIISEKVETFGVRGPGVAILSLPQKSGPPKPMQVTWTQSMGFDNVKHLAVFTGAPKAHVVGESLALAGLECSETLTVQLKEGKGSSKDSLDGDLVLDWMEAVGAVRATGAESGADNIILGSLDLQAVDTKQMSGQPKTLGKLRYIDATETGNIEIPGEGYLGVTNKKPPKQGQEDNRGESSFHWIGSMNYDGTTGEVTFHKDVELFIRPDKGFAFNRSLAAAPAGRRGNLAPQPEKKEQAYLFTNGELKAKFKPPEADAGQKMMGGAVNFENQTLSYVDVNGGVKLEVGPYTIRGESLHYDFEHKIVKINGKPGGEPVLLLRSGEANATYKSVTLDMNKESGFFSGESMQGTINVFGGK